MSTIKWSYSELIEKGFSGKLSDKVEIDLPDPGSNDDIDFRHNNYLGVAAWISSTKDDISFMSDLSEEVKNDIITAINGIGINVPTSSAQPDFAIAPRNLTEVIEDLKGQLVYERYESAKLEGMVAVYERLIPDNVFNNGTRTS